MAKISDLSNELLVKILSLLETKDAVSTSILSKQWEFLWMWLPTLEFDCKKDSVRDFVNKNLPLHRAPIIKKLSLSFRYGSYQADDSKTWVGIAVSRGLKELSIIYYSNFSEEDTRFLFLPSSLFTCDSLVTLELKGKMVLVDVPQKVCLPSLKNMKLTWVTYSNKDSLQLLLSSCPFLEDLLIDREDYDNVRALVIKVPSLQRLSLVIDRGCSNDGSVIVTPSLKYFEVDDERRSCSYLIEHMPELEKAVIFVARDSFLEDLLKSISSVKRLSLSVTVNSGNETMYGDAIVFSKLEKLKLYISSENWSKLTYQLLKDSPNLQVLDLRMRSSFQFIRRLGAYEPGWCNSQSLVPECLKSLKIFYFRGPIEEEEEEDFVGFIFKNVCWKSTRIFC